MNLGTADSGIGGIAAKIAVQGAQLKTVVDTTTDVAQAESIVKLLNQLTLNLAILLGRVEAG